MLYLSYIFRIFVLLLLIFPAKIHAQQINIKEEYAVTLQQLTGALMKRQLGSTADSGAIQCAFCNVLHTRAAEAMYPFAVMYGIKKDKHYLAAAKATANWLMRQQQTDGSWKETPEEWTGTTTDQLLMMLLTFDKIAATFTVNEKNAWTTSMRKAADYLYVVMKPEFASINYVATSTATLAKAGLFFKEKTFIDKARMLAHRTVSKMDEDGFINGEGGRSHKNKYGVDLGYDMEMSLWGLGLYARLTHDTLVDGYVKKALKNHLYFIYPDGSLDASWGIRSNKWTGYGSATSDGCQVLFSLYADEDKRYASASFRNLEFLRKNIIDGLVGYGLQHAALFKTPACIYPSFAKAKNIAMAYELETKAIRDKADLPADATGWLKLFPTLDVVEIRTKNFMATITGYRYKDPAGTKGKYMYRPTGGAVSHLWMSDHGFLQASSPTVYTRPEPMSFPEAPGVICLTPRIEYTDSVGYFTNLYEFDSRLSIDSSLQQYRVTVSGELKDKDQLAGGVAYRMEQLFGDQFYQKSIQLTWHDAGATVKIIEPFIHFDGMRFEKKDNRTVIIQMAGKKLELQITSGNASWIMGKDADKYWTPYPALKAYPLELEMKRGISGFTDTVTYRISLL